VIRVVAHDRFAHHGSRSGYIQVLPHLAAAGADVSLLHLPLAPRGFRSAAEWWTARGATSPADTELHLYPEQTLFPHRNGAPVVAVCHQPIARYRRRTPRDVLLRQALAQASAIVALGPEQARGLRALNPVIELVPHGVDVDWFSPAGESGAGTWVAVGGWLRDAKAQAELVGLARA
jgi:hypothetical protein